MDHRFRFNILIILFTSSILLLSCFLLDLYLFPAFLFSLWIIFTPTIWFLQLQLHQRSDKKKNKLFLLFVISWFKPYALIIMETRLLSAVLLCREKGHCQVPWGLLGEGLSACLCFSFCNCFVTVTGSDLQKLNLSKLINLDVLPSGITREPSLRSQQAWTQQPNNAVVKNYCTLFSAFMLFFSQIHQEDSQ